MIEKTILVLATKNKGKSREIREMLEGFPIEIRDLNDFGPLPEVREDGKTFEENAYKKSSFIAKVLGFPALADDSGLEVRALGGEPGVHSARYSGEGAVDAENNSKLLKAMEGKSDRRARFCCTISLAVPSGPALIYEGICEGLILDEPRGENGFGYDPLFFHEPSGKTFAEMSIDEKSRVSHRGIALAELRREFEKISKWLRLRMEEEKRLRGAGEEMCHH
jgi:XTP/dITP diphosphohydrolase